MRTVEQLRDISITGGRVRLRGLAERDLRHTLAWRNDARSLHWFKNAMPIDAQAHSDWYSGYVQSGHSGCMFFVEGLDGSPIGQSSIYNVAECDAEVGRFLSRPELRGSGYFREALLLTLHAALEIAGLTSVHLEVIEDNERAIRLYDSVGFERTTTGQGLVSMCLTAERFASIPDTLEPHISQASDK